MGLSAINIFESKWDEMKCEVEIPERPVPSRKLAPYYMVYDF